MFSIYRLVNTVNGKVYIGKTNRPTTRLAEHLSAAKRKSTFMIHGALRKYGVEAFVFEVIFSVFREKDLNDYEKHFITEYDCCILDGANKGYNMTRGGDGFSSETAKKYAGWNNPDYVNPWAGENGSKMSTMLNLKRVQEGNNPWAGEKGSALSRKICEDQVKEGRHPFQQKSLVEKISIRCNKQIAEGTHPFQHLPKLTCHCGKTGSAPNMRRWHFTNCKIPS